MLAGESNRLEDIGRWLVLVIGHNFAGSARMNSYVGGPLRRSTLLCSSIVEKCTSIPSRSQRAGWSLGHQICQRAMIRIATCISSRFLFGFQVTIVPTPAEKLPECTVSADHPFGPFGKYVYVPSLALPLSVAQGCVYEAWHEGHRDMSHQAGHRCWHLLQIPTI